MGSVTNPFNLTQFVGPEELLTSSELLERIVRAGIGGDSARQLIRRKAEGQLIWRSERLILSGGGRLFARRSFRESVAFIPQCLSKLNSLRPGIARAAHALLHEEVVLRSRAELLLASPVIPDNSSYPAYQNEVEALIELGIARVEAADSVMERLARTSTPGMNAHAVALRSYARASTETVLANLLFAQFRQQNLISWNTKALPDKSATLVMFNNFQFSATGFSWLKPMLRFNGTDKPKPVPVVLDVFAKTRMTYDVESFIERLTRAGQNKNRKMAIFGIIAAFDFDPAAWKMAKSEGLMAINLKQHFGDAAFEALVQIQELLKNVAGEPAKANDEDYKKLADTLDLLKTNPYVVDLRSLGFESVSGLIVRTHGYENINLNLKVMHKDSEAREVDVSGEKNGGEELFVVECKAEAGNKLLDPAYVRKFYTETVPAFIKSKNNRKIRECRAEIWTTGQVGPDALQELNGLKLNPLIKAALLDRAKIKEQIPQTLGSCARLLEAIATS
ncbi:MAG: hypothetical protein JWM68_2291 [Verrucomicrobiales bacterium]|nr:hypothetical protein [Verrucomicrobiales bacterium]